MTEYLETDKFKEQCLKVLEKVRKTRKKVIITKKNKPIVQLSPIEEKKIFLFGALKDTVHIHGDIISPIEEVWDLNRSQ